MTEKRFVSSCCTGLFSRAMLLVAAICLFSCEKAIYQEVEETVTADNREANSLLQVRTRSGEAGDEASVSYPVSVYVFDDGERCVAVQTIGSEDDVLGIRLAEGTYTVLAVGGAAPERYDLPSQETATQALPVTLKAGQSHGDLMAAKSSVVLVDGGTNTLTLAMERKVMLLQSVKLSNIPAAATAVSVTLSPLWQSLAGTAYAGGAASETIALTKTEGERTWTFTGARYLLPPSDSPASIMVNVTTAEGTSSYTYNTADELAAGYRLSILGAYTEAAGITLHGTLTAAAWSEKTISFEFNESGTQAADASGEEEDDNTDAPGDGVLVGKVPAVGSTYKTCYVLSVKTVEGISTVTLLSPKQEAVLSGGETEAQALEKVAAALPSFATEGISGWRVMTYEEAEVALNATFPNKKSDKYLVDNHGELEPYGLDGWSLSPSHSFEDTDLLRPVTTIKMRPE